MKGFKYAKILTVEDIYNSCINDFNPINKLEGYTFNEKKQFLTSLRIVKKEIKELQDKIIAQNLDQPILLEDRTIKIKDKINLMKNILQDL